MSSWEMHRKPRIDAEWWTEWWLLMNFLPQIGGTVLLWNGETAGLRREGQLEVDIIPFDGPSSYVSGTARILWSMTLGFGVRRCSSIKTPKGYRKSYRLFLSGCLEGLTRFQGVPRLHEINKTLSYLKGVRNSPTLGTFIGKFLTIFVGRGPTLIEKRGRLQWIWSLAIYWTIQRSMNSQTSAYLYKAKHYASCALYLGPF